MQKERKREMGLCDRDMMTICMMSSVLKLDFSTSAETRPLRYVKADSHFIIRYAIFCFLMHYVTVLLGRSF